jgi:hypothetical protein
MCLCCSTNHSAYEINNPQHPSVCSRIYKPQPSPSIVITQSYEQPRQLSKSPKPNKTPSYPFHELFPSHRSPSKNTPRTTPRKRTNLTTNPTPTTTHPARHAQTHLTTLPSLPRTHPITTPINRRTTTTLAILALLSAPLNPSLHKVLHNIDNPKRT